MRPTLQSAFGQVDVNFHGSRFGRSFRGSFGNRGNFHGCSRGRSGRLGSLVTGSAEAEASALLHVVGLVLPGVLVEQLTNALGKLAEESRLLEVREVLGHDADGLRLNELG